MLSDQLLRRVVMGPNDLNLALKEEVACDRPADGSSTAVASGSGD
jgi:hypothetical protein